jgi:hypothetical protein
MTMPKAKTRTLGAEIQIGNYGLATNEHEVEIPDALAREFAAGEDFIISGLPKPEPIRSRALEGVLEYTPFRRGRRR